MDTNERELIFKNEIFAVVGAAMEVSNEMGAGFLEAVYQEAMQIELAERKIPFEAQVPIWISYKEHRLMKMYVPDLVCYDQIIVEIKAVKKLTTIDEAQLINYLKATSKPVGLLLNFGAPKLEWKRMAYSLSKTRNLP